MRSLINAFAMTIFFTSSAMADITIGNFSVSTEKDPFGEADKYIAATVQKGSSFAVRCLSGELSLAFFVSSKAREGQDAEVKLRIDEGKVDLSQYNLSNYASFFDAPIKLFGDANIGAAQ